MQSVSHDDVRKRLLEKLRFECIQIGKIISEDVTSSGRSVPVRKEGSHDVFAEVCNLAYL